MCPTYEKWKYCGHPECKRIATYECDCGYCHPEEWRRMAYFPKKERLADHYKWVCGDHYYEE